MSKNIRSTVLLTLEGQVRELMGLSSGIDIPDPATLLEDAEACAMGLTSSAALHELLASAGIRDLAGVAGLETLRCDLLDGVKTGAESAAFLDELGHWLAEAERASVTKVVADILAEDGWSVDVAHGSALDGIEARLGDDIFLVAVGNREIVVDQAESSGRCAERQAYLEERLRSRGVILSRVGQDDHGDAVGPLIAVAGATGEPTLALGIARHATSAHRSTRPRSRTTTGQAVQRRHELAGEAQ